MRVRLCARRGASFCSDKAPAGASGREHVTSFSFQMMTVRSSEQEANTCPNSGCAQSTFQIAARWPARGARADQSGGPRREAGSGAGARGGTGVRGSAWSAARRERARGRRAHGRARTGRAGRAGWAPKDWQIGCQLPSSSVSNTLMLCPPPPAAAARARRHAGTHGPAHGPGQRARARCRTRAMPRTSRPAWRQHALARAAHRAAARTGRTLSLEQVATRLP